MNKSDKWGLVFAIVFAIVVGVIFLIQDANTPALEIDQEQEDGKWGIF